MVLLLPRASEAGGKEGPRGLPRNRAVMVLVGSPVEGTKGPGA